MKKIFLSLIILSAFLSCTNRENTKPRVLPILGNYDIDYKTVKGKEIADTVYPEVPDFKYLNQDSAWVSKNDFKGKILIVDFMFTHCPDICPPMTSQMKRLSILTKDLSDQIQFISFTIDPERDTPFRFRQYIREMGIDAKNWSFLTGDETETYDLALQYFHVGAQRSYNPEEDFLHDDEFVLVDKEGHVRGLYAGTETEQIDKLHSDIRKLLKYEYNISSAKN